MPTSTLLSRGFAGASGSVRPKGMTLLEVLVSCFLISLLGTVLIRTAIISYRIGHEELERSTLESQAILASRRIESDILNTNAAGVSLSEESRFVCHPITALSPLGQQVFDTKLIFWRIKDADRPSLVRSEILDNPAVTDSEDRGPYRLPTADLNALSLDAGRKTLEVRGISGFTVENSSEVEPPQVGGALNVVLEVEIPLATTRKTVQLKRTVMLRTSGGI